MLLIADYERLPAERIVQRRSVQIVRSGAYLALYDRRIMSPETRKFIRCGCEPPVLTGQSAPEPNGHICAT